MPLGILLLLIWLVLLVRFPRIMLPVSGILLALILLLASVFGIQQWRAERQTSQVSISINYAPEHCDFGKPLAVTVNNDSERTLSQLNWQLQAVQPGFHTNLIDISSAANNYQLNQHLQPAAQWRGCYTVPRLRSGYRADDLEYHPAQVRAEFSN